MTRVSCLLPIWFAMGCPSSELTTITIATRPEVENIVELRIELSNAGDKLAETRSVGDATFPATFHIEGRDRTGPLTVVVDAFDDTGTLIGRGSVETSIEAPTASLMLEPADFLVRTHDPDKQRLSLDTRVKLAATSSGRWWAISSTGSLTSTETFVVLGGFDGTGRPKTPGNATLQLSESTIETRPPAIAATMTNSVAAWMITGVGGPTVCCRKAPPSSGDMVVELEVGQPGISAAQVSIVPLESDKFVVSWVKNSISGSIETTTLQSLVVTSSCGLLDPQAPREILPIPSHTRDLDIAANGNDLLYAWYDDTVHLRTARVNSSNPMLVSEDIELPDRAELSAVHVAAFGNGFAAVAQRTTSAGSQLELYRLEVTGQLKSPQPTIILTNHPIDPSSIQLAYDFASAKLLVVWHACTQHDDCEVFGRFVSSSGEPAGDAFQLATTRIGSQRTPAAVALPDGVFAAAWLDLGPSTTISVIRARVVYPPATPGTPVQSSGATVTY